jgi:uracil-DNA glycosylase family 4
MLVGERPGDYEAREGKPFVRPGRTLFDEALEQAGVERAMTYRANVVLNVAGCTLRPIPREIASADQ